MAEEVNESDDALDADEYGSLSIEDDEEGTVDPAELAGTGAEDDDGAGE